jgi:hypothetical protein
MKICSKCKKEKELDEFNNHKSTKNQKSAWCKSCILERSKEYYVKNKTKQLVKYQKERQTLIFDLKKDKKCEKCGETNPIMLDFHHIDPTNKTSEISDLVKRRKERKEIEEEIKKCIVLCANHHREFHYLEHYNGLNIKQYIN